MFVDDLLTSSDSLVVCCSSGCTPSTASRTVTGLAGRESDSLISDTSLSENHDCTWRLLSALQYGACVCARANVSAFVLFEARVCVCVHARRTIQNQRIFHIEKREREIENREKREKKMRRAYSNQDKQYETTTTTTSTQRRAMANEEFGHFSRKKLFGVFFPFFSWSMNRRTVWLTKTK